MPSIGESLWLKGGDDLCIMAVGTVANEAIAAADKLADNGINAAVVLVHSVKPLPLNTFEEVSSRFKGILTVEEHSRIGGFGESFVAFLGSHGLQRRVENLGTDDKFMPIIGSQEFARSYFGIDASHICEAAERVLAKTA